MQDAFGLVVFAVVGVGVVVAVVSLWGRSRAYDHIGAGGLSMDGDHPPEPEPGGAQGAALREEEIRQLLEGRNARRLRRGEPALDVEAELARLEAGDAPRADPAVVAELRELVVSRNRRRERQGRPPLDVEAEVARRLADLG